MKQKVTIRLYIPAEYLSELKTEAAQVFTEADRGNRYYVELPAEIQENEYLGEYIIACCETLLIMMNPKYGVDETTELDCELLRLGKTQNVFNLLISIKYPSAEETLHDIMLFRECEIEEFLYSFEFIGDQRIFAAK